MIVRPGSLLRKENDWLRQRASQYAVATAVALGAVSAKWFGDAHRVDSNVQTWGDYVFWQSYYSSFTPWPHIGLDLTGRCKDLPGNLECMPIIVPDLNPTDRLIHSFLNLKVPFTDLPLAPLIMAGTVLGIAFGVYRLTNRLHKTQPETLGR